MQRTAEPLAAPPGAQCMRGLVRRHCGARSSPAPRRHVARPADRLLTRLRRCGIGRLLRSRRCDRIAAERRSNARPTQGGSMSMLSQEEQNRLCAAESLFASPIPVQSVSSDEFMPGFQTPKQREFETRVKEMGARMAKRVGMSRRRFFQTAAGMATAFLAMNDTYGPIYGVSRAEAAEPERADDRAKQLSS